MKTQIKHMIWRLLLVMMTLGLWASLVAAQEEPEAAEQAVNLVPIWFILLVGLAVIAGLGYVMNSRDRAEGDETQR